MRKMLLLTRFVKEYEPTRIADEARELGMEVDMVKYGQVDLGVVDGQAEIDLGGKKDLFDYDLVVPRAASKKGSSMVGIKTILLQSLEKNGSSRVLNGTSFAKYPLLGKMEQGVALAKAGLPTVDFLSFGSKKGWKSFRDEPKFNFPMIMKGRFGSHGRTVKLINDWAQFDRAFGEYKEGVVLIQPKLRVKQWYRCVVVGDEYLGEMRHRQKDKYGGEGGKMIKFGSLKMARLGQICLEAAKLFECDYAGIDVAYDEDKEDFVILEVNRTAQFKYFEKRTQINVAKKMLKWMMR